MAAGPYPSADAIARALVTAAALYGERPMLRCVPRRVFYGHVNPPLTSSWQVLKALCAAYPHLGVVQLAGWVGLPGRSPAALKLGLWLNDAGDDVADRRLFRMVAP